MRWPWIFISTTGLLVGTFFAALSLTPSLVPRDHVMQGVLVGLSFAVGYGTGVFGHWLWAYLELPAPTPRGQQITTGIAVTLCVGTTAVFLWQAAEWQNSVRTLMEMAPVSSAQPFRVGAIALLVAGTLLTIGKLFGHTFSLLSRRLQRFIPRRVANVFGILIATGVFWSLINGVLFELALRAADSSYQQIDALIEDGMVQPADPQVTGSTASLLAWDELGRQGRNFIASGPTAAELNAFLGEDTPRPLRVYVGLNSAPTVESRARLALAELERIGAFTRSALVLITPTGTGWVDPGAIDTFEYLHRGDVASVAVQYSYLPSPLSLLVEPEYGLETARVVFAKIYEYWSNLDADARPALYLHGLSLGALNSDHSFDVFDIIADPPQGALWSGPPFRSETWRSATDRREPDSPAWLPRFREGSVVRFTNQTDSLHWPGAAPWGPLRIVYLQYASDPVTFFEPQALYREPEWMRPPRGPDVSPELRWYPIVTMLQLAADMAAGSAPPGHGHEYAAEDYIDAWLALTEPEGWSEADIERLKDAFRERPASTTGR